MKRLTSLLIAFCVLLSSPQQPRARERARNQEPAVTMMSGMGDLHHSVSTSLPEAQNFFDQGLRLIYAFNHDEAARSFHHAAELDPKLAMAWWGVAESIGPNYNDPADPERFKQAHDAVERAVTLSATATPNEKAYIEALAKRFPSEPNANLREAAERYRDAMRGVVRQFPDDLDAATLFAEAGMNLHPWGLWRTDGTPEAGTEEIVSTLESVLRRDPNHMGSIHYYIHAVEASPNPERALAPASRLAALAPAAGHLVHMPGHVYIRTGDYESAVRTNERAAAADRAYIGAGGGQGIYSAMYYSHNLHFIAACSSMDGDYASSRKAAEMLVQHVAPLVKEMPPLEGFMTVPMAVEVRFQKWDEILKMQPPDSAMKTATVFWHFGRGMALAGKGRVGEAETEYKAVAEAEHNTPPDAIFNMPVNNKAKDVLKIAENVLAAKIELAKHNFGGAVSHLREAAAIQDSLKYGEPPDWFFPVRESLGGVLLLNGNAREAEKVFRDDLERNPRNPRSLFGLRESLKAEGRALEAQFVDQQFQSAWKSSTKLTVDSLT